MAVRSKLLFASTGTFPTPTTVYTAPAGETALVKWLTVGNAGALANLIVLSLNPGSGPVLLWAATVGANQVVQVPTWYALPPGAAIIVQTTAALATHLTIHGAELEGVAD